MISETFQVALTIYVTCYEWVKFVFQLFVAMEYYICLRQILAACYLIMSLVFALDGDHFL